MKPIILFVLLVILSSAIKVQPFAPKIDTPKNPGDDIEIVLVIHILKSVIVPDVQEVGISPYPGARIFQITIAQAGMLPAVRLLSKDEQNAVIEYYKKDQSNWTAKDLYSAFSFVRGDEMKAMVGQLPFIQIWRADMFSKTIPNAPLVMHFEIENEYYSMLSLFTPTFSYINRSNWYQKENNFL